MSKRQRIIWLENDVAELKSKVEALRDAAIDEGTLEEELANQSAAFESLAETVNSLTGEIRVIVSNQQYLSSNDAKVWLSEMDRTCSQVKTSVEAIHGWQNQMAKDFSAQLCRTNKLADKVRELKDSRLKLAALADDRIRDLERELAEATENGRAAVSRMEQLETRLRKLEDAPRLQFGTITVSREGRE